MTNLVSHPTIERQAYKILDEQRTGGFSGYSYPKVGEWTPFIDQLAKCIYGYHVLVGRCAVFSWINHHGATYSFGSKIYCVDTLDLVKIGNKWLAKSVRLIDEPKPFTFCHYSYDTTKLNDWLRQMDQN